jgi:lipopolysaccharide transport system permease protein
MQLNLLLSLTKRDFTERYSGSVLGVFWSFIWPLISILIYTVIFAKIMGARLPGVSSTYSYGIYLVAGLVPWTAFANTVSRASTVFVDRKHIISKISVSLPSFPLFIVLSESITFVITLFLYFLFLLFTGAPLNKVILFLPFIYFVQQVFAYALGFFIAIFHVFIKDLKEVTGIVLQLWFWFTPIVYVHDILPDYAKKLILYNPAFLFVKAYQDIFVFQQLPKLNSLILLVFIGHSLLLVTYLLFKKLEKDVRDFI